MVEKSFPWLGRKEEGGLRRDEGRRHERAPGRGERGVVTYPKEWGVLKGLRVPGGGRWGGKPLVGGLRGLYVPARDLGW